MPRYYFNLADGVFDPDPDGTELPDIVTARSEAVRYAVAIMRERPDVVWDGRDWRVEVTGADRELLFTLVVIAIDATAARRNLATPSADNENENA